MGRTGMKKHLDFYFDFSSPFGFLASIKIKTLAEQIKREIHWHPFMIGAVFKEFGGAPIDHPLKRAYNTKDFHRRAKLEGLANARFPDGFPNHSIPPARLTYWIAATYPEKVEDYVLLAYKTYWIDGQDTTNASAALDAAAKLGISPDEAEAGMQTDDIKSKLRTETENAIQHGVFGSPFILIDGEPFWGGDRFADIVALYGD